MILALLISLDWKDEFVLGECHICCLILANSDHTEPKIHGLSCHTQLAEFIKATSCCQYHEGSKKVWGMFFTETRENIIKQGTNENERDKALSIYEGNQIGGAVPRLIFNLPK